MKRQKKAVKKSCQLCDKEFLPWRMTQQFCSRLCGQKTHLRNYWLRKLKAVR